MSCLQHMKLDVDIGDGIVVPLCARYSGFGTEVLRNCGWCCFNSSIAPMVMKYAEALQEAKP